MQEKLYEVTVENGYIRSRVWGEAGPEIFEVATEETLALHERSHVGKLLCDIREMAPDKIGIAAQVRGIGTLWRIRVFDKVAFVVGVSQLKDMLHASLKATNLSDKFHTFDNEAEALAWLEATD